MIIVRHLKETDKKSFKEVYTKTIQEYFPEYTQKTRDYFTRSKYLKRMFRSQIRLGAFENNKLVGYLLAQDSVGGVIQIFWISFRIFLDQNFFGLSYWLRY